MLAAPEQGSVGQGMLALSKTVVLQGAGGPPPAPEHSLGCLSRGGGWGLPTLHRWVSVPNLRTRRADQNLSEGV